MKNERKKITKKEIEEKMKRAYIMGIIHTILAITTILFYSIFFYNVLERYFI